MNDRECTEFLQWALPRLGLRWPGYRKVRRLVGKRLAKRLRELGITDLARYRARIEHDAAERAVLDALCRIPISRFYRDRGTFDALRQIVLPRLAARASAGGRTWLRAWSAGCAAGEEPYTLRLVWDLEMQRRFPAIALEITATDVEPAMLRRARTGCYSAGSLRELPPTWLPIAFGQQGRLRCLRESFRAGVEFVEQDIRVAMPEGVFDLVLCRNLVFTYFAPDVQRGVAERLIGHLAPGGVLAIGIHEHLPAGLEALRPLASAPGWHERIPLTDERTPHAVSHGQSPA
ncbi:MAG: CheR family methyltransferase [Burkholderiales bacterium]